MPFSLVRFSWPRAGATPNRSDLWGARFPGAARAPDPGALAGAWRGTPRGPAPTSPPLGRPLPVPLSALCVRLRAG
eukprot:6987575-Pyramimonas_sp.AAC.1